MLVPHSIESKKFTEFIPAFKIDSTYIARVQREFSTFFFYYFFRLCMTLNISWLEHFVFSERNALIFFRWTEFFFHLDKINSLFEWYSFLLERKLWKFIFKKISIIFFLRINWSGFKKESINKECEIFETEHPTYIRLRA